MCTVGRFVVEADLAEVEGVAPGDGEGEGEGEGDGAELLAAGVGDGETRFCAGVGDAVLGGLRESVVTDTGEGALGDTIMGVDAERGVVEIVVVVV